MRASFSFTIFCFCILSLPFSVLAKIEITEIMYDLEGTDGDREWVEIYNSGSESIDLSSWKFFEANTNHSLTIFKGSATLGNGDYAIISSKPESFLNDWPSFEGAIFDSSFSLNNTGESLTIKNSELVEDDSVSYTSDLGANGDGNSLQKSSSRWISAGPTPGAQNSQTSSSPDSSPSTETTQTSNSQDQTITTLDFPVEPQIFADAGQDKTCTQGVVAEFRAKSYGLKKEPLENTRYIWNFGDGTFLEGQNVLHTYKYVGDYIVFLSIGSGKYSAADKMNVKVIPNQIKISGANDDSVKIKNDSNVEVNISEWFIRANGKTFKFPENSFIKGGGEITIDLSQGGFIKNDLLGSIELLYPNGSLAGTFSRTTKIFNQTVTSKPVTTEKSMVTNKTDEKIATIPEVSFGNQESAVILSDKSSSGRVYWWLGLTIILGLVASGTFIFVKRKSLL